MGDVEYPYKDSSGFTMIGPECFTTSSEKVISWKGENYYTMEEALRIFFKNLQECETRFSFVSRT